MKQAEQKADEYAKLVALNDDEYAMYREAFFQGYRASEEVWVPKQVKLARAYEYWDRLYTELRKMLELRRPHETGIVTKHECDDPICKILDEFDQKVLIPTSQEFIHKNMSEGLGRFSGQSK